MLGSIGRHDTAARRAATALLGGLLALGAAGCATYEERVAPVPMPAAQADHVTVAGAKLVARAYAESREAQKVFGFDVRGAGLLPVRFVMDNQSGQSAQVVPDQTFLIDRQGQAWPLLSSDQAYQRVKRHVEVGETFKGAAKPGLLAGAAGAVAGAAVGVLTGENVGESAGKGAAAGAAAGAILGGAARRGELGAEIREDLAQQSLQNRAVEPGDLAYGYLFFPGRDEAESARELRLALEIGGTRHVAVLPLR